MEVQESGMDKRLDRPRLLWVDFLKTIGLLFVVWGHFLPRSPVKTLLYSFHVPLFFLLSGFLVERLQNGKRKLKFRGLLVPYVVWTAISLALYGALGRTAKNVWDMWYVVGSFIPIKGFVCWNAPLWFLYVLFLVRFLSPSLDEWKSLLKGEKVRLCIVLFILGGVCIVIDCLKGINVLAYRQIGLCGFFYTIGMCISRWEIEKWFTKNPLALIIVFIMGIACAFLNGPLSIWSWAIQRIDLLIGSSFGICIVLFVLCGRLCRMGSLARPLGFFYFGHREAVFVLSSHYFFVQLWCRFFPKRIVGSAVLATCMAFAVFVVYLLLAKLIKLIEACRENRFLTKSDRVS